MTDLSEAGTSVEVKPCPFCGDPMRNDYGTIKHVSQGACPIGAYAWGSHEAIAAWNRRTLIQPTPAETEGDQPRKVVGYIGHKPIYEGVPAAAQRDVETLEGAAKFFEDMATEGNPHPLRFAQAIRATLRSPTPPPIGDGEGDLVARLQATLDNAKATKRGESHKTRHVIEGLKIDRDRYRLLSEMHFLAKTTVERELNASKAQVSTLSRQLEEAREALKAAEAYNAEYGDGADTLHHGNALLDFFRAKETVSHG